VLLSSGPRWLMIALAVQNLRVQDKKNTFAFGYGDLGKLGCQIQQAIATDSVLLVFSYSFSLIALVINPDLLRNDRY